MYHQFAQFHQAAAEHGHTGNLLGLLGSTCELLGLTALHQAPNETFVVLSGVLSGKLTQQLYPDCYICRTLVSLVTYAPLSCCGDWSEATSAGHA